MDGDYSGQQRCLCNYISKWFDFKVFSNRDYKLDILSDISLNSQLCETLTTDCRRNKYYVLSCHVTSRAFVRWRSVSDGNPKTVIRRPEEISSVPQLPILKAFATGRTQACNLEPHCAMAPRCIPRLLSKKKNQQQQRIVRELTFH